MITTLINLTAKSISVFATDGKTTLVTVPPSGAIAHVSVFRVETGMLRRDPMAGIPVFIERYGAIKGLPAPQVGKIYLVSEMVRKAAPSRRDVLSPGELIRDANGHPVGCRGLESNV